MILSPVELELVTEGLVSIVREMRQTVFRTAHSPVIAEAQDFSCALFSPDGEMVAQGRDMPGHVVAMPASVAEIFADFAADFAPGDMYIVNDPYRGGSHLNDVTLISPVFVDGELFLFPCVRMHWSDIGGMTPGSVSGKATEIFQEGLRIPPIQLVRRGVENHAAFAMLFANIRMPEERRGDLESCIAACQTAEGRLHELVRRHGRGEVLGAVRENMNRTEYRLRSQIRAIPDGTTYAEDYIDLYTDGDHDPAIVRCALTVREDEVVADFRGSSQQVAAVVNSSAAMTAAGVFIAVKSSLDPGGMVNAGAFRPIRVVTDEGTVVHVSFPAPANAHSEVRKRVISVVMAALSQVVPDQIAADQFGTTFQNLVGGVDSRTGRPYLYYDYPAGGNGGYREADGPSAMNPVDLGDISTIQSVERLETDVPILVERCELRTDSGGAGEHRGGLGVLRATRLLASDGAYSVQTDRTVVPPYGLLLGGSGATTSTHVEEAGEIRTFETPGKVAGYPVRAGSVLVMQSAGGGGWQDPLARDVQRVAADVRSGYVSRGAAFAEYGVVLDEAWDVDEAATAEQRRAVREARTRVRLAEVALPAYRTARGSQRLFHVPQGSALPDGALCELHGRHPAPLRGWVCRTPELALPDDTVGLGEGGLRILGLDAGDSVLLRVLRKAPG